MMVENIRANYFDSIAKRWDGWEDFSTLENKLTAGLIDVDIGPQETVLDIGCGTGNLTQAVLKRLAPAGRVLAFDISARMLEVARAKISDQRVSWYHVDARRLPLDDGSCDRVICYSVWPHFDDHVAMANEFWRVLRPGGLLHVWHLISRERVNEIHRGASEAVSKDLLVPAPILADMLTSVDFTVLTAIDNDERYLVTATKRRLQTTWG